MGISKKWGKKWRIREENGGKMKGKWRRSDKKWVKMRAKWRMGGEIVELGGGKRKDKGVVNKSVKTQKLSTGYPQAVDNLEKEE